jgi:hypothetical protein
MLSVGGFYVMVDGEGGSDILQYQMESSVLIIFHPCIYLCSVAIRHIVGANNYLPHKINPNGQNDDQSSKKWLLCLIFLCFMTLSQYWTITYN